MAEQVAELLQGAVDIHIHSSPDLYDRRLSHLEAAADADAAGMKAIVIKSHNFDTVTRTWLLQDMLRARGMRIEVFGSLNLNHHVGGLNPVAVETALKYGARKIFMPTVDAEYHRRITGRASEHGRGLTVSGGISAYYRALPGIRVLDAEGRLLPEVREILRMAAAANVILSLGHLSAEEMMAISAEARALSYRKVVVDHPFFSQISLDMQAELVERGAVLNYTYGSELSPRWARATVAEMVEGIRRFGAERIVLSSDCGQLHNPPPVEALRVFLQLLLEDGVTPDAIRTMIRENPCRLLYDR